MAQEQTPRQPPFGMRLDQAGNIRAIDDSVVIHPDNAKLGCSVVRDNRDLWSRVGCGGRKGRFAAFWQTIVPHPRYLSEPNGTFNPS